jgi:hypothetical protein
MAYPHVNDSADRSSTGPTYPAVAVQLSGIDGNAYAIIGRVAAALRRQVGNEAADTFTTAAHACTDYDRLLQLAMDTVTVS